MSRRKARGDAAAPRIMTQSMHQAVQEVMHPVAIAMRCLNWQLPIRREFDMRGYDSKATLRRMACVLALVAGSVTTALAQPATLRLGYGTAAEEPLWLIVAKPDLARNQG